MPQGYMTDEQHKIIYGGGLCVATVPETMLSGERLKLENDEALAEIKDELMRHMEAYGAHSGILLLAPALGARRFGPKPASWLAQRVGLEFSHSADLASEADALLQHYCEMVQEMAEGHRPVEIYSIDT
jgi:hypothetical protein